MGSMFNCYEDGCKFSINTFKRLNTGTVIPPLNIAVAIVIRQVVVKNICLISLTVLRIDKAKAIAPRRPANHSKC